MKNCTRAFKLTNGNDDRYVDIIIYGVCPDDTVRYLSFRSYLDKLRSQSSLPLTTSRFNFPNLESEGIEETIKLEFGYMNTNVNVL